MGDTMNMTDRLKSRDKVNNLKAGDIISIYTVLVEPYLKPKHYERELFRLIITKMRISQIETVVLFAGENISQNVGDKYVFALEGLVGANWRMA
jgi:hypothetical protein